MNSTGFRRGFMASVGWLAAGVCAFAQSTNLTVEATPLPDVSGSVVRVFGALALVLAVFFGGVWFVKNWQRFGRFKGRTARLNILETRVLGNRHTLYVVGYDQQRMLVGTSPAGVVFISHLSDEEAAGTAPSSDFAAALDHVVRRES